MKKQYSDPEILIEEFVSEDIMETSVVGNFDIDEDFFF